MCQPLPMFQDQTDSVLKSKSSRLDSTAGCVSDFFARTESNKTIMPTKESLLKDHPFRATFVKKKMCAPESSAVTACRDQIRNQILVPCCSTMASPGESASKSKHHKPLGTEKYQKNIFQWFQRGAVWRLST